MKKSKNDNIILGFSFMYSVSVDPMDRSIKKNFFILIATFL